MIGALITFIVYLLVLVVVYFLVDYVLKTIPIQDPPARIIRVVMVVLFCLIVILLLLNFVGVGTGIGLPRITG